MNTFELIEKYLPESIDKYFAHDSKSVYLEKGKKFIDVSFKETGYVKIANILLDGLSDYYQTQQESVGFVNPATGRPSDADEAQYAAYAGNLGTGARDGFKIGGVDVKWEIYRLQWVRGKQFRIDYISNEETAGIMIGNALEEFHRLKVIPEVDVARFSFIADQAAVSLGNMEVATTIAANSIIAKFNSVFEWMTEMGIPEEEQIIFINPSVMTLIRNTTELTKFLTQGDYRSEAGLDFTVEKYMNRPIIEVPSDRFYTNALMADGGPRPQTTSKVINFMVVSTKATVPIRKLEYEKIYGPELSGIAGFHGYIINYLLYHGIFVPKNKVPGIWVSVSDVNATTKASLLRIQTLPLASHAWKLVNYFTNPAGMRGTLVYSASTFGNLGSDVTVDGETVKLIAVGQQVAETEAKSYHFGYIDALGRLIAKTSSAVAVNN